MENTRTPTEAPSPHNPRLDLLRAMADALLEAFNAAPVPKDHAGIGKAARTLISLTRLIKALSGERTAPQRRQPLAPEVETAIDETGADITLIPPLNRKQRRREDKFRRSGKVPDRAAVALSP